MTATIDDVRQHLAAIPEMMALLPDALGTRSRGPQTSRPVPGSRPPVDLDILDLTDCRPKEHWADDRSPLLDPDRKGVLPYLDDWVQDLATTGLDGDVAYGIAPHETDPVPDEPTVTVVCDWLARHLDWAETLPQWPEFADGVRVIHGRLRAATRHVRDVEEKPVPCGRCGAGALVRVPGTEPRWECDACDNLVNVQAVTINQAAKIMDIKKDRLYALVNRPALLREAGVEAPRRVLGESGTRKLYDLGDLRRLVAEVRVREGA